MPRAKQRRFNREEAQEVKRQVEELLRLGKIRVSRSESAVGTLFVPKSDGTKRWCMDLRPVNAVTYRTKIKHRYKISAEKEFKEQILYETGYEGWISSSTNQGRK